MRGEPFRQALRTYLTRDGFWIVFVLWLLPQVAPLILLSILPELGPEWIIRITGTMFACDVFCGMLIGTTLVLHFGYPQTRLLPRFATTHVAAIGAIVAAAVLIRILVAFSWAGIATSLALGGLGVFGITAGVSALGGMERRGIFFLGGAAFSFILPVGLYRGNFIRLPVDYPVLFLVYGGVGLFFLATLPRRIRIALEDTPLRTGQDVSPGDLTSARAARLRQQQEAESVQNEPIIRRMRDAQFDFVFRDRGLRSPWGRLLLRQLTSGFAGVLAIPLLCVTALLFSLLVFLGRQDTAPSELLKASVSLLSFITLFAMFVGWNTWESAWPRLAMESLRPLGRRELIGDLLRSCACDLGIAGVVHCAIIVCWKMWLPDTPPGLLLPWIVLTIATYVVAYSVLSWLASFRRSWIIVPGAFALWPLSTQCIYNSLLGDPVYRSPLFLVLVVVGTAVAAVLMYRTAFRRWCHVDLA